MDDSDVKKVISMLGKNKIRASINLLKKLIGYDIPDVPIFEIKE